MASLQHAELIPTGIQGDRYANDTGAYSQTLPSKIRHISLITQAGIEIANEWLMTCNEPSFTGAKTRRNIAHQQHLGGG